MVKGLVKRFAHHHWLLAILLVALLGRLAAAGLVERMLRPHPGQICLIAGDAEGYWNLARHIVRGEPYSVYDPPRRVLRMPGFPLLLAGGMLVVGDRPALLRGLLAIVGTVACGLVYLLGLLLFDRQTGLIAAGLAAVSPLLTGFSVLLLSETFFATMMLVSLVGLAWLSRRRESAEASQATVWPAVAVGALAGLATLVRPTWLLVVPGVACLWLWQSPRRKTLVEAAGLGAGLMLAMLPWTIRNAWVTGHFVPTTLWVGPSLYDGLNPTADGSSDMQFIEQDRPYQQMSEYDVDHHYRRLAWNFVKTNPWRTVELATLKAWRYWNPVPNSPQFQQPWLWLAVAGFYLPVLGLAVRGAWVARHRFWNWFLPLAPILYFAAVHMLFVGSLRYRLPAEYPLLVLSAVGLQSLRPRSAPASSLAVR